MITLCVIWNLEYHKLQGNTPNLTNQIKAGRIPESKKSLEIFERKLALVQAEIPAAFTGRFVPLHKNAENLSRNTTKISTNVTKLGKVVCWCV